MLTLNRPVKVVTAAGGVVNGTIDEVIQPQLFRIVPFKNRLVQEFGFDRAGDDLNLAERVITGSYTSDVKKGDYFIWEGYRYEVLFVSSRQLYRVAAAVRITGPVEAT